MSTFKVFYRDLFPSNDLFIGRGVYIEADSLEHATDRAKMLCRRDEEVESVRLYAQGKVA